MSNNSLASLQAVDVASSTSMYGTSKISAKPRPKPTLVSTSENNSTTHRMVSREEALRQAILRTG